MWPMGLLLLFWDVFVSKYRWRFLSNNARTHFSSQKNKNVIIEKLNKKLNEITHAIQVNYCSYRQISWDFIYNQRELPFELVTVV